MKLTEILEKRISNSSYDKAVVKWLSETADDIIRKSSAHLVYVRNALDEFDIHSAEHSKKVLEIMEDLLGSNAEKLSSYDLFSLIAVAYLHDCGMAVSDYEVNVMKLVENDNFDGKKVLKKAEAINFIKNNKKAIFPTERDAENIKNWLFYPGSEQKLNEYYAQLLIDYQSFRNGKKDLIKKFKDHPDKINKELRLELIRRTHADRAETYIRTWSDKEIADFIDNQAMGEELFGNIAMACKAHGEDVRYIKENLDKSAGYLESETSNLQFVAMMLRIGDLVHFDYDRAPVVLRALHHFESDYSYEQWRIKTDSGVNFTTKNGTISCKAYCKKPKDYYNLSYYVDYIDNELSQYNRLRSEEDWDELYPVMLKSVDRSYLKHDKKLFTPYPNLKFTLEQNRILDLLMGAELYSDEYACLRELYQNSLDACRCQIASNKSRGTESKGKIEFGLGTDKDGNKYVYCLDNGKGMSRHIIENYLLRVGSSYYKSPEFYQSQAETGNTFTPTSQFGIGILSCFMIGDRLEITTRELGGNYESCVMENIHECFYYKTPSQEDKDAIDLSGTLIKIFLNEKYKEKLNNEHLDNIGYLLWKRANSYGDDKKQYSYLDNHLYCILDAFVEIVPKNIYLDVKFSDGETIKIFDKPQPMGKGIFTFPKDDDNKYNNERIKENSLLNLEVEYDGLRYRNYLALPKKKDSSASSNYSNLLFGRNAYCVDGIKVDNSFVKGEKLKVIGDYQLGGVLCFMGSERPQLSISREKIVKYEPYKYEEKIEMLLNELLAQAVDKVAEYISVNHVMPSSELYEKVWYSFFNRFEDIPVNIVKQHLHRDSIKDLVMPLPTSFISNQMTFGEFFGDIVDFEDYNFYKSDRLMECPGLMRKLIIHRIASSNKISFDGTNVHLKGYFPENISKSVFVPMKNKLFQGYDIVTSLYPFLSKPLPKSDNDDILFDFAEFFLRLLGRQPIEVREYRFFKHFEINIRDFIFGHRKNDNYMDICLFIIKYINSISTRLLSMNRVVFEWNNRRTHDLLTFFVPISRISKYIINRRWFGMYYNDKIIPNPESMIEGLSVVVFGYEDFYVVPNRWSRQELIDKIPDDVWNRLSHHEFYFSDGVPVRRRYP